MTLDEAIKHAQEVIENLEKTKGRNASDPIAINCFECADEHRQLAEWLKELKALKENDNVKDVFKDCDACKYLNIKADDYPCDRCMHRYVNQYVSDDKREVRNENRE